MNSTSNGTTSWAPPTEDPSPCRSRPRLQSDSSDWCYSTQRQIWWSPTTALRRFWQLEHDLLEAGDLDDATELNLRTWLGPDADQHTRDLTGRMQRRAFELQRAAGEVNGRELEVDLTHISAPTTIVVGGHDLPFSRATANALAAGLPHAELVDLPWAGHLPSLERPSETAELVRHHL